MKRMRQSLISNGDTCHARLGEEFYWHPEEETLTEESLTGTAFHAVLEAQALLQRDNTSYDASKVAMGAILAEVDKSTRIAWRREKDGEEGDVDTVLERALRMAEYYIEGYWYAKPDKFQIVGVELFFELPFVVNGVMVAGWTVSGTVDLLCMDENGWLHNVDYKGPRTKKRPGWENVRNTPQMAWYFEHVEQWWQMTYPGDFARYGPRGMKGIFEVVSWGTELAHRQFQVNPTRKERDYVMKLGQDYARLIDQGPAGLFITSTDSHLCHHKWCDYWYVCPAGEALNKP